MKHTVTYSCLFEKAPAEDVEAQAIRNEPKGIRSPPLLLQDRFSCQLWHHQDHQHQRTNRFLALESAQMDQILIFKPDLEIHVWPLHDPPQTGVCPCRQHGRGRSPVSGDLRNLGLPDHGFTPRDHDGLSHVSHSLIACFPYRSMEIQTAWKHRMHESKCRQTRSRNTSAETEWSAYHSPFVLWPTGNVEFWLLRMRDLHSLLCIIVVQERVDVATSLIVSFSSCRREIQCQSFTILAFINWLCKDNVIE